MRTDHQIDLGRSPFDDEEYAKIENRIWYHAKKDNLFRFYKTSHPTNRIYPIQEFYRIVPGNYPVVHYPLADLITKTMVGLIFSEKPVITMDTGNKSRDEELDQLLEKVFNENDIEVLLQKAAELESYSGAVAFKPVLDPEFSDYPIIIPYPKEDIELVRKYNRVSAVIFKDYYEKEKNKYVLYTECGKGYIDYKLMKLKDGGSKPEEVPLDTLEETTGLKRLDFVGKNGQRLNQLMCVYKENKTNATSDYTGIIDDFQALDEVYSNMLNFIRKSKIHTYLPENMCRKDEKGNTVKPFDYHSDYTILYDSNPEGTETQMTRDVVDIQNTIDGYITTFNEILKHAVLTTGLSTASIGYDISGANASGEALSIREKVSMRTRSEKVHRWTCALTELSKLIIAFQNMIIGEVITLPEEVFEYEVLVAFAEYESPSMDAVVESLSAAKEAGLIDTDTALKRLWEDEYSEEEIELMKLNIQEEQKAAQKLIDSSLFETEEEDNNKEE